MSEVVRLTLVSHAMTDAMSAGRFPRDEPVNRLGRDQIARVGRIDLAGAGRVFCGPEARARQTAELLGLAPAVEPLLADLDCGRWQGDALSAVAPDQMAVWLTDAASAPHGGESVADLIARTGRWLAAVTSEPGRVVAVTHPAVVRAAILAALDAPAKSFWRVDVAPVSCTAMHFRGHAWTLRTM
ncbi:histidine phosphatase family protein [Mycobacterium sp. 4D054]|uniref:histidine phosphatase family protein n=1 Tax=unclassified Mycobacterium TaxID=2642494 RepID=UPI0021B1784B|nr:histidine phosphatase family protein [Mycobacterium sp. SMC-8]UXA13038.1 histidine phosphatase family protein [Mycobacterium sp. SMC-8]